MEFINRRGESLTIDVFDQQSIDAAKAAAPGEGVGPAIARELFDLMEAGTITVASQLPPEYRPLGAIAGLPPGSAAAAQPLRRKGGVVDLTPIAATLGLDAEKLRQAIELVQQAAGPCGYAVFEDIGEKKPSVFALRQTRREALAVARRTACLTQVVPCFALRTMVPASTPPHEETPQ